MNKAKSDALQTVITMYETFLFDKNKANHVYIGRVSGTTYIRRGEENMSTNVFSITKSFFGLWALVNYILNNFPIDVPLDTVIERIAHVVGRAMYLLSHRPVIEYINHISGIVSGATSKNKDSIAEIIHTRILGGWFDSYDTMERGVWVDETIEAWEKREASSEAAEFRYSNYGIQYAGLLIELFYRMLYGVNADGSQKFCIRQECVDMLLPFVKHPVVWPTKNDKEARMHTCTFSGLEMTGYEMRQFGEHLYSRFLPFLRFLWGDTLVKPDGSTIKNKFSVFAPDKDVDPGFSTVHEYFYSWGFWLPQIRRKNGKLRRFVVCHGMFGNRIGIDIDSGLVFIRKQNYDNERQFKEVVKSMVNKTSMNTDPSFDWYVSEFQEAIDRIESAREGDSATLRAAISEFEAALKVEHTIK